MLQLPERLVTRDGKAVSSAPSAQRRRRRVVHHRAAPARGDERRVRGRIAEDDRAGKGKRRGRSPNRYVQVSRLGNPLVNEVVIPLGKKDRFNRTTPDRDAALYGKYVVKPELAAILNALFKIKRPGERPDRHRAGSAPGTPRAEPAHGRQGRRPAGGHDEAQPRFTPPAASAENRFGVIGGDNAGFPNGRRLGDDVVDIELQVVAGFL